ncbi:hypothetical protein [Rahnella sp. ChDrAdgB13]|uniref:DUF4875 domain-containing protein n=1 Tax=Rahnella sp. ChDrAdgB13 TaxID=1850581 RepID=UPI001AD89E67|nr:hypothetical protein [Rahnella sp. ChDrAdgB13]
MNSNEGKDEFIERRTVQIMGKGFSREDATSQAREEWSMESNKKAIKPNKGKITLGQIATFLLVVFIGVVVYTQGENKQSSSGDEQNIGVISAPANIDEKVPEVGITSSPLKEIESVPFTVECLFISSLFTDNHKLARVDVSVSNGDQSSWAATMMAAAEAAKESGADSIEISLLNSNISKNEAPLFREIGHAYFMPKADIGLWTKNGKGVEWSVYAAKKENLMTKRDIDITNLYDKSLASLISKGVEENEADKIAGNQVAKKFNLKPDWRLPTGSYSSSSDEVNVSGFSVNSSKSRAGMDAISNLIQNANYPSYSSCN